LSHLVVVQQVAARSLQGDPAVFEDVAAVAQLQGLLHFLRHEQDGETLLSRVFKASKTLAVNRGERPSEGSSSMRSLGTDIKALPMASICCSPPLSSPALWFFLSRKSGKRP